MGSGDSTGNNTCNFSIRADLSAALNVNSSGSGTWLKRHIAAGQDFSFAVILRQVAGTNRQAMLNATQQATIGGQVYTVTENYIISDGVITGTQRFERAGCFVLYQVSFRR